MPKCPTCGSNVTASQLFKCDKCGNVRCTAIGRGSCASPSSSPHGKIEGGAAGRRCWACGKGKYQRI